MSRKIEAFKEHLYNKDFSLLENIWESLGKEEIFVVKKEILSKLSHIEIYQIYKEISMFNEHLASDIFKGVFEYDQARIRVDNLLSNLTESIKSNSLDDKKSSEDSVSSNENINNVNEDIILLMKEFTKYLNLFIDFNSSVRLEILQKTIKGRLDYLINFKKEIEQRNDLDEDVIKFLIEEEWRNINRPI